MMLQQLKIGTRLGVAFSMVLIVTALISAIGAWRLGILNDATNNLATVELQRNALAQKWSADINLKWVRTEALAASVGKMRELYRDPRSALVKKKLAGEDVAGALTSTLRPLAENYLNALQALDQHMDARLLQSQAETNAVARTG